MLAVFGHGATKRAFFYLTSVVLLLSQAVTGSPERNFDRGQPELQQAMDNMVFHGRKKSSSEGTKAMFNTRATTLLLDEAENMLSIAKDIKEKEWLQHFVYKLKTLASVLEENIANYTRENDSFVAYEIAQSLNNSSDPNGYLSLQNSSDFKSETVPETGPGQMKSNQMTSKLPLTLPEENQMKSEAEYATIDHVARPRIIPQLTDDIRDELVEQLESLRKLSSLGPFDRSIAAPETSSTSEELLTRPSSTPERKEGKINVEREREKLKERIAKEVVELKMLGEENILNAMQVFNAFDNKVLKNEGKQSLGAPVKRILDENTPHYWNLPRNHNPPRQIYTNKTFLGINSPSLNPRELRRQFHHGFHRNFPLYHDGLKGTIQTQRNQNFVPRNHGAPNFLQERRPVQQQRAGGMKSETRYSPVKPIFKSLYMPLPYPLNQQLFHSNVNTTTYAMSKVPTEFTEEMKRQLRDGKVIIISDSVVSSNYTSDREEEHKN